MNLSAITDVNRIVHMINEAGYDIAPEKIYDQLLLDTLKLGEEHYVHLRHTESYSLPRGARALQKRRWGGLTAVTTPLLEGIPPAPDKTSMEEITFTATQFGRWMEFTDRVDFDQIDPIIWHYTKELGDVINRTKEKYARETLLSTPSKMFAGNALSVGQLHLGDVIRLEDLRYQTLRFDRLLVKPIEGNYFNYICSPEHIYDMVADPLIDKYMQINNTTRDLFDSGKPFPLFRINFIRTMLDEHYTPELDHVGEYYDGTNYNLRVVALDTEGAEYYRNVAETGNRTVNTTTIEYLSDGTAVKDRVKWTIPALVANDKIEKVTYNNGEKVVTEITIVASGATGNQMNVADANALNWVQLPVHKGILYGAEGLVKIGIDGQGDAKVIIKGLGSAGVNDPLDQRQSIGVKVNSFGLGLLRPEAVVATYSVPTNALFTSGLTAGVVKMAKGTAHGDVDADDVDASLAWRDYTVDPQDLTE